MLRRRIVGAWAVLAMMLAVCTVEADDLTLSRDGRTEYVVVTSAQPTAEEATAAEWLASTLEQVTGAKFPVKSEKVDDLPPTLLRVAADATLESEEWRVKTDGKSLGLTGGRPRGTIYAVCEFLETHVGVVRLDPFTESVPSSPTLVIRPLDRRGRPAFPYRFVFTGWPYQNAAPQGPNGINGARWRVWNKEHIYAGPTNGDYPRAAPDGVHTFGHFISAKEFAAEHPEYFSMDADGKRMTNDMGNKSLWIQLCVTNPDVRRITLERAKQMLRDDGVVAQKMGREPAHMIVLSQNDNTTHLCLCPNCKAISDREGSESGPLLEFVNHVARGLRADFPDAIVLTEAYNFTLAPPKTIRPEPNVLIRYCDNYGLSDMTRPLSDPRNAERLALLDGWAQSAQQLGVWDYWRTFEPHPPGLFAPSSNVRAMASDIRLFRERNVKYVTIECEDFLGAGFNDSTTSCDLQSFMPLRAWLGMKLLDDPDRDVDQLLGTFCRGYYGKAAAPMRELLEVLEERQAAIDANSSNMRRHAWLESLCDADFFASAYRCLDAAAAAAEGDRLSSVHVRRERIIIDSAFLWREAAVREQSPATPFPQRADVLKRHRADWSAYVSSVFDTTGQEAIAPLLEPGLQLLEKLNADDAQATRLAVHIDDAAASLDGRLDEPFWREAKPSRLLPRDPRASNDDRSQIRFAWTNDALVVGLEQPAESAAAIWEVSLMTPDRQGVQALLHAQPNGSVAGYFYAYPATGMVSVPGRKSHAKFVSLRSTERVTAEFRIPWTDLPTKVRAGDELLCNVAVFPKSDSRVPSHVSSPWLIGASPTYHPAYYGTIRLSE
ncbi:MAG: DUF4838 domain-containing protein [Pirellulales bacterium]